VGKREKLFGRRIRSAPEDAGEAISTGPARENENAKCESLKIRKGDSRVPYQLPSLEKISEKSRYSGFFQLQIDKLLAHRMEQPHFHENTGGFSHKTGI
jgi:hypothetical protein